MRRRISIPILIALLAVGWTAVAGAERIRDDGIEIRFDAGFAPQALPRSEPAPVKVQVQGQISTLDGSHPPPLRQLELEINRNGILDGQGLPVCRASALQSTSTQTALERCGSAKVGQGSFKAQVALGREVISTGKILAFNSRHDGRPALLLHLFAGVPVRFTLVVPLEVKKLDKGQFGTIMSAKIPRIAGIVSVTRIGLQLGRRYSFEGKRRSYVSAACGAPRGFSGASFNFVRGRFRFEGHRSVAMNVTKDCAVR